MRLPGAGRSETSVFRTVYFSFILRTMAAKSVSVSPAAVASWRDRVGRREHARLRQTRGAAGARREKVCVVSRAGLGRDKVLWDGAGTRGWVWSSTSRVTPTSLGSRGGPNSVRSTRAYQNSTGGGPSGDRAPEGGPGVLPWIARQLSYQKKCIPLLRWPKRGFFDARTWMDLMFDSVVVVLGLCAFVALLGYSDLVAAAIYRLVTALPPPR